MIEEFKLDSLTIYRVSDDNNTITIPGTDIVINTISNYRYAISTGFADLDKLFQLNTNKSMNIADIERHISGIITLVNTSIINVKLSEYLSIGLYSHAIKIKSILSDYEDIIINASSYGIIMRLTDKFSNPPFNGKALEIDNDDYNIYCSNDNKNLSIFIDAKKLRFVHQYLVNTNIIREPEQFYSLVDSVELLLKNIGILYFVKCLNNNYRTINSLPRDINNAYFQIFYGEYKTILLHSSKFSDSIKLLLDTNDLRRVSDVEPIQPIKNAATA